MISRLKSLPAGAKASLGFLFANIISSGIAYLTTPLYTRLLTPDEYGQTTVFLTWLQVFGIVAMFCLSYGVFNNGMLDYKNARDEYSLSMLALSNLITVCFTVVLLAVYPVVKDWIGMDLPLVLLMCALFLFQPAYNFYIARKRYELKYKSTVVWTALLALLSPTVALICIFRSDNHLHARIFGAEIPLIVVYAGFCVYIMIRGKGRVKTKYWKEAVLFNLPLIPHYLSTYLLGSSDKIMIANLINDSAAAYYGVAYSVASVAMIVWSAVNSSLIPYTYEKCEKKDYKAVSAVTMPILTVFAALCMFVILLAPEVVGLMAPENYTEAVRVIPPIVGGVFFQVQYFIYANVVYYHKKPKYVMFASVTAAVLNVALNYIFIPRFGYAAAGYTTLFCYFVQAAIDYFAMRHVVHTHVYPMRYLGLLSLGVVVVSLFSTLLYNTVLIRYAVIVMMAAGAFLLRRRIAGLVTAMRDMKKDGSA